MTLLLLIKIVSILQKLFLNRTKLEEGEPVVVRPNLNGWIFEEGKPPFLTQTVHTRKGKGTVSDKALRRAAKTAKRG